MKTLMLIGAVVGLFGCGGSESGSSSSLAGVWYVSTASGKFAVMRIEKDLASGSYASSTAGDLGVALTSHTIIGNEFTATFGSTVVAGTINGGSPESFGGTVNGAAANGIKTAEVH